jgi:predicted AAA+ superfamily ATPase
MTPYLPRELSHLVAAGLAALPAVVVTGLRQAGKTTFLQQDPALRGRRYLTLDDFATLQAARSAPEALVAGEEPVTIDEVQRSPELLLAVKREIDRRRAPGRFLLSGSANLALLDGVSDSLAGRALYLTLHPFSRRERLGRLGDLPILLQILDGAPPPPRLDVPPLAADEVLDGGLPPVALGDAASRGLWFLGYEQTYLERDVRDLSQVADIVSFRNLLHLAALRTGQLLNQSDLARDARLPATTAARYLGLLEASFVVSRLPPHLKSRAARLIKSPKVLMTDSGLAAHLTAVHDLSPTADERLRGALFETFVGQNLAALLGAHRPQARLEYWSVQGRHEVDFVVSEGRNTVGVEVKAATRFGERDLTGLRAFAASTPGVRAGILAYNGSETLPVGDRLWAVPLAVLLA